MKNVFLFANLFALMLLASCKKQPEPVAEISTRTEVLANIGQNVIVENFVSFQSDANGLVDAVDTYVADSTSAAATRGWPLSPYLYAGSSNTRLAYGKNV